jgi:Mg-chelatase subunit ChlD
VTWIRKPFSALGVTQYPPGPAIGALQGRLGAAQGTVLLCIDVSSSMSSIDGGRTTRLARAIGGSLQFTDQARRDFYRVGLVLWNHGIHTWVPPDEAPEAISAALMAARPSGGTDISPTLRKAISVLGPEPGDRVVAVFGDGDIGPRAPAQALATEAARLGIRIIARGLGEESGAALDIITTETIDTSVVDHPEDIERSIASMAIGITRRKF